VSAAQQYVDDIYYNPVTLKYGLEVSVSVQFLNVTSAQKGYLVPFKVYMMDSQGNWKMVPFESFGMCFYIKLS